MGRPHGNPKDDRVPRLTARLGLRLRYPRRDDFQDPYLSADNVISYIEMCRREGTSLQAGMNFGLGGTHSVILMSVRPGAPYRDSLEDGGTTLLYEGHDSPRAQDVPNPKLIDQPAAYPTGAPTQNGKFHRAAQDARAGLCD